MKTNIRNLASVGLISDQLDRALPPEAWSALQNIRIQDGKVKTFAGHSELTTPTVTPYYLLPVAEGSSYYWIYPGLAKVYVWNGSSDTDITRAAGGDYTGSATDRWNGCVLNGIPVLNNGVDDPQMFTPVATTTDLQLLTDWNTDWKCKVMRAYKYFLVALNMTEGGGLDEYPHKLRWSNSADPGAVPSAWTPASSNNAGSNVLGSTGGFLVDGLELGDIFVIYKEDSVHGMQHIGGNDVFRFWRMRDMPGILAQDCMASFSGGHFVVSKRDVYIHDGQNWHSVIDERNRDYLFDSMDGDNYASCFVAHNRKESELLICYPEAGSSLPNKALVWNYKRDVWYPRDLPASTFITNGIVTISAYTWDTHTASTWDTWAGTWGSRSYSPIAESLVGASTTLHKYDDGNQFAGVNPVCYAERTGLKIGDANDLNTITAIYPQVEGDPVDVYVGSQMAPNGSVTWNGPYTFDPDTDSYINCMVTGLYHAIKYQTEGNVSWGLTDYEAEYEFSGQL